MYCARLLMLGDIFLMLPHDTFVPGRASLLVAPVGFTVGFALRLASGLRLTISIVLVVVIAAPLRYPVHCTRIGHDGRGSLVIPGARICGRDRGDGRGCDRCGRGCRGSRGLGVCLRLRCLDRRETTIRPPAALGSGGGDRHLPPGPGQIGGEARALSGRHSVCGARMGSRAAASALRYTRHDSSGV